MDYFYLFLVIGALLVFMILKFDKMQRRNVSNLVKKTKDVQPLLMGECLKHKTDQLKAILAKAGQNVYGSNTPEQDIAQQLDKVTKDFKCGRISRQIYNHKLSNLLERAANQY